MKSFAGFILICGLLVIIGFFIGNYFHNYGNKNGLVVTKILEDTDSTARYKCEEKVPYGDYIYMIDSINRYKIGDTLYLKR